MPGVPPPAPPPPGGVRCLRQAGLRLLRHLLLSLLCLLGALRPPQRHRTTWPRFRSTSPRPPTRRQIPPSPRHPTTAGRCKPPPASRGCRRRRASAADSCTASAARSGWMRNSRRAHCRTRSEGRIGSQFSAYLRSFSRAGRIRHVRPWLSRLPSQWSRDPMVLAQPALTVPGFSFIYDQRNQRRRIPIPHRSVARSFNADAHSIQLPHHVMTRWSWRNRL